MKAELQPVEVRWVDSASTPGWHKPGDLKDVSGITELRSLGFLTRCDRTVVQIALSRHIDAADYAMYVGQVLSIPRSCVRKIAVIKGLK